MTVELYNYLSDNNKMNKPLTLLNTLNCTITEESSVVDPVIIISGGYFNTNANYMYISDFNRYYYITDQDTDHQRIVLKGHVDVLRTYKEQISNLYVIADRSSSKFNLYQKDNELPMEARNRITMSPFSSSFQGEGIIFIATGNG